MSDIRKIKGRYYDFGCKNESFLKTAEELKAVGIKNYYFMLRINNPAVADIDPFKPNITREEVTLLLTECRQNLWFFARTMVRMRTDAGIKPLSLHRGLAAAFWCFERHQDSCLCEPRQTYKTTGILAGPIQWAFQLSKNMTAHFFGKETSNTKKNLNDLKNDLELLPEWLQFARYSDENGKEKKSKRSTESLTNEVMKNQIVIHPKATSLASAQNMGRGGSGAVLYFDEIEHTLYFPEIMSNSAPLFKTASENAAAANSPYGRIFTCTPGNLDTKEGIDALPIIKSMIPWTEKVYDMTEDEIKAYKAAWTDQYHNSKEEHTREVIDVFYIEYQYYQLRRDYNWVLDQYKLSGDKMAVRREILMQRLRGSNESPFDAQDIEYMIQNMQHHYDDLIINGKYRFLLYEHGQGMRNNRLKLLDETIPYMIGVDPAAAEGNKKADYFAVTVVNPYNLKVAAEFRTKYISGPDAVRMLVTLVSEYIPKALVIPEKNSMGCYLIQMLRETSISRNIYWSEKANQIDNLTEENDDTYALKAMSPDDRKYGTYLTPKVRKAMIELLIQHVHLHKDLICSEYLVDDICKLIRKPTGRIEALDGEHDDSAFSFMHVLYIYYTEENLMRFGIDKFSHPIDDPIQSDFEERMEEQRADMNGFFSVENATFSDELKEAIINSEINTRELVNTFSFVHDDVYSPMKERGDLDGDGYEIPMAFFDMIN